VQYRKFGKLDWQVSVLGFGTMRLPHVGNNMAEVIEAEAMNMLRYAIDHGVNYIDTAYPYHDGNSEVIVGRMLKENYGKKVKVATKLPSWEVQSPKDFDRFLNEQLKRLQRNQVDFYLLHGLNKKYWTKLQDFKVLKWAEKAMNDGRIGHLGFSFHDDFNLFKEIVDAYDNWTLCQIQYNYMDENYQAGKQGLQYATSKGLAVVVMEPLRGGRLTRKPPEAVADLWATAPQKRAQAEWGLLWVWNQPEVSVVLSGMSTMEQVVENIAIANHVRSNTLSTEELELITRVQKEYRKLIQIPCTACGYCMPCESGVQIPRIFELYNDAIMYDDIPVGRFFYAGKFGLKEEERADRCLDCGDCVEACPQRIPVSEWLKKAHELLRPAK
jgi:predicted aldo/keto reductase-like oxidoreductase